MDTHISHSPEETFELGKAWGKVLPSGTLLGLSGDLGAGKTELVKGIALGLGSDARVHSPTFALLNEYHGGRLPLVHLDLYRLQSRGDVIQAGLEDYLRAPPGVTVAEWIERWFGAENPSLETAPSNLYRHVRFEVLNEFDRRIDYEDFGT
jgi:tRNA threonylcarbamoyladenosine biosynthesis protein TsaE